MLYKNDIEIFKSKLHNLIDEDITKEKEEIIYNCVDFLSDLLKIIEKEKSLKLY